MPRVMCYRCFWPQTLCWCSSLKPMMTKTRFLFLMHPKEYKQEKAGTGRLTQLCLPNSSLHMAIDVREDDEVGRILADERFHPVLLYPGVEALNLSAGSTAVPDLVAEAKTLLVVILDATWSGARKMLRLSAPLRKLPRIMFTPKEPSRYVIKQQPQDGCLSTLEATHELLMVLEARGLDAYPDAGQLLSLFKRMQDYQIQCACDPGRPGYRRAAYSKVSERRPSRGRGMARRENYMKAPTGGVAPAP
ncbi:MAG TPA: tRNA-uridine aminocarboxypropyltransferase [Opitutaceae bacterium]|nr:tRNA-uridine aminocarboxypropyltransferase [Opitutaceae bacterium]